MCNYHVHRHLILSRGNVVVFTVTETLTMTFFSWLESKTVFKLCGQEKSVTFQLGKMTFYVLYCDIECDSALACCVYLHLV